MKMRGVIEVFDIGAVHAEDVGDVDGGEMLDDVVDHPVLPCH